MSDKILQMAKAHMINVAGKRDQLLEQRKRLDEEIQKIEEYLKDSLQEIESQTIVGEGNTEPNYDPVGAEQRRYANRKDFS